VLYHDEIVLGSPECHIPDSADDPRQEPCLLVLQIITATPATPATPPASLSAEMLASHRVPCTKPNNNSHNTPVKRSTTKTMARTNQPVKQRKSSTLTSNIDCHASKPVPPVMHSINLKDPKPLVISKHFLIHVTPLSAKLPEQLSVVSGRKLFYCGSY
jgi:hypothetical protein